MAVVGTREKNTIGASSVYRKSDMFPLAEAYLNTVQDVLNEGMDVTANIRGAIQRESTKEALKSFFVENSYDAEGMDAVDIEEAIGDMEALFENDVEGILEDVQGNQINPIVGMSFPMHKWILMNMVFDKGGIPKFVAESPKFTITQEIRLMIDKDGNEIDMFKQQNLMTAAMDATVSEKIFEVALPLTEDKEIVVAELGGLASEHLAIETSVYAFMVPDVYFEVGDLLPDADGYIQEGNEICTTAGEHDVWVRVGFEFTPTYNMGREFDRALTRKFVYQYKSFDGTDVTVTEVAANIFGTMKKDRLSLFANGTGATITKARIKGRLDTSSARNTTCSVSWTQDSRLVEIGNGVPLNTTVSPQEVKDVSALFNVNQVTKIMSLTKTVQGNYKDDKIKGELDESFKSMDPGSKLSGVFDFAPRITYSSDHVQWRKDTFLDFLDQHVTLLLQVLNDPNMKVAIFGDPKIVRMITPTTYQYQSPGALGPVELDYTKTVYTSDKRNYSFVGSDKLRGTNELIVVLNPEGSDRIMYRIYDYQYYMSNEIRNADNTALPAIHSFERWKFVQYAPVQGRINILHPSGINDDTYNVIPTKEVTP